MNKNLLFVKNNSKTKKEVFLLWMQTDTSVVMLTTALITARTATAAALTISKSAATKPIRPKQNAPTADPLNIKADNSAKRRIHIISSGHLL